MFSRQKQELHAKLVAAMDLSTLGSMSEDDLRREVRRVAEEMTRQSAELMGIRERDRLVSEVLDETFGLGPLEPLLHDPTHHRHSGQRTKGHLRRARRKARANRYLVYRREALAPDRPADRRTGRPPGRRVDPDGRRPAG